MISSCTPKRGGWLKVASITLVVGCIVTLSGIHWLRDRPVVAISTNPDSEFRRLVVGSWTDNYQGKRTMILKEDGTGTMVVELSGWRAALSAPRLRFDMVWSVEGGHLKKQTVGGEPATQVQMILAAMGDNTTALT